MGKSGKATLRFEGGSIEIAKQKVHIKSEPPKTTKRLVDVPFVDQKVLGCGSKGAAPNITNAVVVPPSQVAAALKQDQALMENILQLKAYAVAARDKLQYTHDGGEVLKRSASVGIFVYRLGLRESSGKNAAGSTLDWKRNSESSTAWASESISSIG